MKKSKLIIIIILAVIALAGGLVWTLYVKGGNTGEDKKTAVTTNSDASNIDLNSWNIYTNDDFGFLLRYPDTLSISEFKEGAATVVLIQEPSSARGFQIFISHWDEGVESLTIERIRRDLPDLVMREAQRARIGTGEGYPAVLFKSDNEGVGETREVWFTYGGPPAGEAGNLYQVRAPISFDTELSWVMSTWTFQ